MAIERIRTRRSTTKTIPDAADLELSEQGYTFINEKLWIRNQLTGNMDCIGGKAIVDMVLTLNRLPIVQAALRAIADTEAAITGNVLSMMGATDPDGEPVTVFAIAYQGTSRQLGVAFATTMGTMTVSASGDYSFVPSDAARALADGAQASVGLSVTVTDGRGGLTTQPVTITITGTNNAPLARADIGSIPFGANGSGNVLSNDLDYEGTPLTVVRYRVDGIAGNQTLGQPVTMTGLGDFILASNGAWTFARLPDVTGDAPAVRYTLTDGVNETEGVLSFRLAPPAATPDQLATFIANYPPAITRPAPNPVVGRRAPDKTTVISSYPGWSYANPLPSQAKRPADALDFEVGPGMPYATLRDVPRSQLLAGDRIFVHWRPQPYSDIVQIAAQGEEEAWIEIIGVPNPTTGQRPLMSGVDAVADPSDTYVTDLEAAGLIMFVPGTDGGYLWKPSYIHITGFEFSGVHRDNFKTNRAGIRGNWGVFTPAVMGRGINNLTVSNCHFHDNNQGLFTNSGFAERYQTRYTHVFLNHFKNNSWPESYGEHNAYLEEIGLIFELNYLDKPNLASYCDNIKVRSAGVVIRYNHFEVAANLISLRDCSPAKDGGNAPHERIQVDNRGEILVSAAFVYGNTFVCDRIPDSIIAVGDGVNEQVRYGNLYLYNNLFICRKDAINAYVGNITYTPERLPIFGLLNTRSPVTVVARNNLFYSGPATPGQAAPRWGLFFWQGLADFSSNWITAFSNTAYDNKISGTLSLGVAYAGAGLNGMSASTDDPGFVNFGARDFALTPSSPYFGLTAPIPQYAVDRGLIPARRAVQYPFDKLPRPQMVAPPVITGSRVEGQTLTVSGYGFTPLPDSVLVRWYDNGQPIDGAETPTFVTAGRAGRGITVGVRGVNNSGIGPEAISAVAMIITSTTPINTSPPTIVGNRQVTFEQAVDVGTWLNAQSFTYQAYLAGVAVGAPAGNLPTFTGQAPADEGKTLQWEVTAQSASGETSTAISNTITLLPVNYDPDSTGRWNIVAPDGTNLRTLSAQWNGIDSGGYGFGYEHFTCQAGALQCTSLYGNWNRTRAWLENSQSEDVGVEARIRFSESLTNTNATIGMQVGLRQTAGQFYAVGATANGVFVCRNGARVSGRTDMTLVSPVTLKVVPSGATLSIYVDGVLAHTYTDPSPLTGGHPGVVSHKDGNTSTEVAAAIEWWTDNPL